MPPCKKRRPLKRRAEQYRLGALFEGCAGHRPKKSMISDRIRDLFGALFRGPLLPRGFRIPRNAMWPGLPGHRPAIGARSQTGLVCQVLATFWPEAKMHILFSRGAGPSPLPSATTGGCQQLPGVAEGSAVAAAPGRLTAATQTGPGDRTRPKRRLIILGDCSLRGLYVAVLGLGPNF